MRRKIAAGAAWLLLAATAANPYANESQSAPQQEIVGPSLIAVGRLASFSIGAPEAAWTVFGPADGTFEACGTKLFFASPSPGAYKIIAAFVSDGRPVIVVRDIFVGEAPDPEPDPQPPVPPPPDGSWKAWAKDKALATVAAPHRKEAAQIAAAIRAVIDAVEKGRVQTPRFAREQMRSQIRYQLRTLDAIQRWTPFSDALDERMDAEAEAGKLAGLKDYVPIWKEIADGLEEASQ